MDIVSCMMSLMGKEIDFSKKAWMFKPGNKGYWLGKKRSKETIEKIKRAKIGKYRLENSARWKGGRIKLKSGYIGIYTPSIGNYTYEHRLVMESHLGRKLKRTEVVHHIDGDKANNALCNLVVTNQSEHRSHHASQQIRKTPKEFICKSCDKKFLNPNYVKSMKYCSKNCQFKKND